MKSHVFGRKCLAVFLAVAALHITGCSSTDDGDDGDDGGSKAKNKSVTACVPAAERSACLAREFTARGLYDLADTAILSIGQVDSAAFAEDSPEQDAVNSCRACE